MHPFNFFLKRLNLNLNPSILQKLKYITYQSEIVFRID